VTHSSIGCSGDPHSEQAVAWVSSAEAGAVGNRIPGLAIAFLD